jgi:hypothetical protein
MAAPRRGDSRGVAQHVGPQIAAVQGRAAIVIVAAEKEREDAVVAASPLDLGFRRAGRVVARRQMGQRLAQDEGGFGSRSRRGSGPRSRKCDGGSPCADQKAAADFVDDADRLGIADEAAGAGGDQGVAERIAKRQQQERRLEHQHLG